MRLWSINPKYLDRQGLLALWRESLLAQAVLLGKTKGYRNHSAILRFKQSKNSILFIKLYLLEIYKESKRRKYRFNRGLING